MPGRSAGARADHLAQQPRIADSAAARGGVKAVFSGSLLIVMVQMALENMLFYIQRKVAAPRDRSKCQGQLA